MNTLHQKALTNAIKLLNAIGAQYAIVDVDLKKHGDLEVKRSKKKRQPPKYAHGVMRAHIKPHLDHIKANETARIPVEPYDLPTVYRSASATSTTLWGRHSHKVGTSPDKKFVLITRTEPMDDMGDLFKQLGIN
jgi:hypothetical protein